MPDPEDYVSRRRSVSTCDSEDEAMVSRLGDEEAAEKWRQELGRARVALRETYTMLKQRGDSSTAEAALTNRECDVVFRISCDAFDVSGYGRKATGERETQATAQEWDRVAIVPFAPFSYLHPSASRKHSPAPGRRVDGRNRQDHIQSLT